MMWRTPATFRRKTRSSQAAGGEGRESMEHPKFEKEFETDVTLRVKEAFEDHGILPPAVLRRTLDAPPPPPLQAVGS